MAILDIKRLAGETLKNQKEVLREEMYERTLTALAQTLLADGHLSKDEYENLILGIEETPLEDLDRQQFLRLLHKVRPSPVDVISSESNINISTYMLFLDLQERMNAVDKAPWKLDSDSLTRIRAETADAFLRKMQQRESVDPNLPALLGSHMSEILITTAVFKEMKAKNLMPESFAKLDLDSGTDTDEIANIIACSAFVAKKVEELLTDGK